ncbi:uncharacterized protein LOC106646710 [Copidosoma floridanum]|uniref:uncharacterized protein LOC106646710 n=1 Tax=Copidosoma floridanum TaxID=29053 RepID=UPI0006C9486E|nr:uncharacterized protein LOC106646710 [Copidosoma floridanum]
MRYLMGLLLLGIILTTIAQSQKDGNIWSCVYESNGLACASTRVASELDGIEREITSRSTEISINKIIEEGGNLLAHSIQAIFGFQEEQKEQEEQKKKYEIADELSFEIGE